MAGRLRCYTGTPSTSLRCELNIPDSALRKGHSLGQPKKENEKTTPRREPSERRELPPTTDREREEDARAA